MREAPAPAGHVTGKGCPATAPGTRRAGPRPRPARHRPGRQRPHLDAKNTTRSLSGCFCSGNSGNTGTAVRMSASAFASVHPHREQPREQPPGQREQQRQEAGPRPARHRPGRQRQHLDAKNTPAKPFRVLSQREQREHGNSSPHECVTVRKRSTPSGTAAGTTARAAGTAAPGGQALDPPGRQRQRLDVPTAGPAGPVAQPQPG